jgi:hypothetical protein
MRRRFLSGAGLAAAGLWVGAPVPPQGRLYAADQAGSSSKPEVPESAHLKSWEVAEFPSLPSKIKQVVKVIATSSAFGISRMVGGCKDLAAAEADVGKANLLEHENLHDLMVAKGVPKAQLTVVDIACWDLHARMPKKPLHGLLGTKKTKILRYGDVRGQQPDFSPQQYAAAVAR